MHEKVFRALDQRATIVAASRRLARGLIDAWHARQRSLGHSIWHMPNILPLDAFLDRLWADWLLHSDGEDCPRLLNPLQEQVVWEQIILESPAGETLLQISDTARTAAQAWELIHAYRIPVDGRFEAADDWSAFRDWSHSFAERCRANRWMERARLSDFLIERIKAGEVRQPAEVYRAGFDDLTPQQVDIFETLNAREIERASFSAALDRAKSADVSQEIRAAAEWARRALTDRPGTQIGIIVPELTRLRPKVERIFQAALNPAAEFGDTERSFHISLGPGLAEYPMVRAALLVLKFAAGGLPLPQFGVLLRSPFLGGAETEWSPRASLDAKLRRRGIWDVTVDGLRAGAAACPALQRLALDCEKELRRLPEKQTAQEWSRAFTRLLKVFGWPGERALSSREHQVREAWGKLLSSLSSLDLALPPITYHQALARLSEFAMRAPFQVENEGAPIQIMGVFEAAGLNFDQLWIMGANDEALPKPPDPNPFLPISVQREYALPRSSPERELEYSRSMLQRLLVAAPHVVISYAEREGDRALMPSPLVPAGVWRAVSGETPSFDWIAQIRAAGSIEQTLDEAAPAVAPATMQTGGSSLFKDIAACAFRAFAKHRLQAKPLESSKPGLSYLDRGNSVHKAMEAIWAELGSQEKLSALMPDQLRHLVARGAAIAVRNLGARCGAALEQRRLETLLLAWLEIEKTREPFLVSKTEDERLITVKGLQIRTRADRVDELPDGRSIIIDYKTGRLNSAAWDGDRPDEPQLPLYCYTSERPIAGAAFAQIRTGELGFRGLTEQGVSLPVMKPMSRDRPAKFEEQIAQWNHVLETLAEQFIAGTARVDPKPGACDNCGVTALCRIQELRSDC